MTLSPGSPECLKFCTDVEKPKYEGRGGRTGREEEGGQVLHGRKGIFPRAVLPPWPYTHSRAVCCSLGLALCLLRMHSRVLGLQQAGAGDGTVLWDQEGPTQAEPFLLPAVQPLTPLLMNHTGRCRHLCSHLALFVPSVLCMLQSSHFRKREKLPKASYSGWFQSLCLPNQADARVPQS